MSKILIEGNKVIIDGHANDLETCNTLTNLCDELSTSDKFRTVKYESGYGEFESVSENEEKKFAPSTSVPIYSNDGTTKLYGFLVRSDSNIEVTSNGMIGGDLDSAYEYSGNKVFLGFSNVANSTYATFPVGYTNIFSEMGVSCLYIVEGNPGYQVNLQSNNGTTTLAQNTTVDSVVVTSTGAQLKYGDTVKATYTYSGSKLFAGLATSANATVPKYKPGDTIEITAETTFYIVENIIIPEHHSSLTELFTNIASVIREKTGDTASIVADDFPSVIRKRLEVIPPPIPYLTFSSPNSFTLKVKDTKKHWDGTLEYSTDTSTWTTWDGATTLSSTTRGSDNVLYMRGTGNTKITGANKFGYEWVLTGSDIKCTGNIENILDYEIVNSGSHPSMAEYCYFGMFKDCTSLTQAPTLPATTLSGHCYTHMFNGCTSLTQAPTLPATILLYYCYGYMFQGCTSLTQAPALPATTLADYCYTDMFQDCTSLTQAPALPATTLANYCYWFMFEGCTSLTQAPALPATTLAEGCYRNMFYKCTSLTKAPSELPATTLVENCYRFMFEFTAITAIPRIMATTYATDSCKGMFDDIKTLNVYSRSGPGHEYGWTAPASTYCSGMFGSDNGESEWAKLDGSNFPNSGTPIEGTTYYFATSD